MPKTRKFRITLTCGFYTVRTEVKGWFGRVKWLAYTNETGTSLFPTFHDARMFLNCMIEGKAFVANSEKTIPTDEYQYEIEIIIK